MIVGKVTAELAAALPPEVLRALDLIPGDAIRYEIDDEGVRLKRAVDGRTPDKGDEEWIRARIAESLNDPRPSIPMEDAFAQVFAMIDQRRRDAV